MTAGSTFVGQFTDHDITFDQTSQLGVTQNPLVSPNTRTPALDLDSVFGGGPGRRPDLYVDNPDGSVGPKLKIGSDREDLLGGYPAPRRYIGWQTFFDLGDGNVKNNKKIDTTISSVLFTLPVPAIAPHTQTSPTVLPQRNLLRQLTWGLPSGHAIARAMGAPALSPSDLSDIASVYTPFATSTPLWYYILAEVKVMADGLHLGPVGGRIVTETLIGLLRGPHELSQHLPRVSAVPGDRPGARSESGREHHGESHVHPRAFPLLRRRGQSRHPPLTPTRRTRRRAERTSRLSRARRARLGAGAATNDRSSSGSGRADQRRRLPGRGC
jgi:hypothetical protein